MASEWYTRELLEARGSLFGFILSLVRDFDLAEELFQEVCVRVLERESEFRRGTDFGAWVREFSRRTVLEEQRHRGRVRLSSGAISAIAQRFQGTEAGYLARREALRHCVEELDGANRKLIDLHYERGLSLSEMGAQLGRGAGAVQVALSRARTVLSKCIQRRMNEEVRA